MNFLQGFYYTIFHKMCNSHLTSFLQIEEYNYISNGVQKSNYLKSMLHFLSKLINRLYFILIPQCEKDFFKTSANSRHCEQVWWQKQPFFVVVIEKLFFLEKLSNIGNMLGEIENPVIFDTILIVAFGTKLYSYTVLRGN